MGKKAFLLLVLSVSFFVCKKSQPPPDTTQMVTQAEIDKKVILKINDVTYTNKDLRDFIQVQYAGISEKKDDAALLSVLFQQFVEQKLVLYAAGQEAITVEESEMAEYLKKINLEQTNPNLNMGLVRDMAKIQKYLAMKVYNGIDASEAEMEKYYQEHMDEFNKAEEIFLYQILLDSREQAIKIRGELVNAPGRFEEIAKKESKSEETAPGGKMGSFERGQLPKEMEDVVFSLKVGEISPVVESPYGFHIFKITRRRSAKHLSYFQVKGDIRDKLLSGKMGAAYQDFLQRLKSSAAVQTFKENLYFTYQQNDGETK